MRGVNLTHEFCGVTQNFLIIFLNPCTWRWPCKAETYSAKCQIWVVTDNTFAFILYTAQSVYAWEERAAPEGHARHLKNPCQNKRYPWLELEDPGHRFKEDGSRKQHFEWSSYQPVFFFITGAVLEKEALVAYIVFVNKLVGLRSPLNENFSSVTLWCRRLIHLLEMSKRSQTLAGKRKWRH